MVLEQLYPHPWCRFWAQEGWGWFRGGISGRHTREGPPVATPRHLPVHHRPYCWYQGEEARGYLSWLVRLARGP